MVYSRVTIPPPVNDTMYKHRYGVCREKFSIVGNWQLDHKPRKEHFEHWIGERYNSV
jgi:hypothetical protein